MGSFSEFNGGLEVMPAMPTSLYRRLPPMQPPSPGSWSGTGRREDLGHAASWIRPRVAGNAQLLPLPRPALPFGLLASLLSRLAGKLLPAPLLVLLRATATPTRASAGTLPPVRSRNTTMRTAARRSCRHRRPAALQFL